MSCLDGMRGGWGDGGKRDGRAKKTKSDPGSESQKFIWDPTVLVSLHGRASSRLASASFLRPGAGERVRLITDRRKKPYSRVGSEAQKPYQEIVPRFEINTRRF